jgi:hypothetical protein
LTLLIFFFGYVFRVFRFQSLPFLDNKTQQIRVISTSAGGVSTSTSKFLRNWAQVPFIEEDYIENNLFFYKNSAHWVDVFSYNLGAD